MIHVIMGGRTWYESNGTKKPKLLRTRGKKCCIGYLGIILAPYYKKICMKRRLALKLYEQMVQELTAGER